VRGRRRRAIVAGSKPAKEIIHVEGRERTECVGLVSTAIVGGPKAKLRTTREVMGEFTEIAKGGFEIIWVHVTGHGAKRRVEAGALPNVASSREGNRGQDVRASRDTTA
jgi:hypothetical protein